MISVWVVGSRGLLGQIVVKTLHAHGVRYLATDIEVDATDTIAVNTIMSELRPTHVVNCAAYTNVDGAEDHTPEAYKLNSTIPLILSNNCKEFNSKLIHVSTDYVFDGCVGNYTEVDEPNPINIYGKTKLDGERNITKTINNYFIIRTSWLFGLEKQNFISSILKKSSKNEKLTIVNDQHGAPTYSYDLAQFIVFLILKKTQHYGIYNYAARNKTTWYELAKYSIEQAKHIGLLSALCEMPKPISSCEYKTAAKRPEDSFLNTDKIFNIFTIKSRTWQNMVDHYLWEFLWEKIYE
jgi:dTDP-4-dehydrorhamnose reductase